MFDFCLDSAGSRCLIVLGEGDRILGSAQLPTREALSETILGEIQTLLERCQISVQQIDRYGIGIGPGGFTSLRVGISTVKGIAYAQQKPIVALGSLALLARSWPKGKMRLVLREAYRGEVYAAAYQVSGSDCTEVFAPTHGKPSDLALLLQEFTNHQDTVIGGSGLTRYREQWLQAWGDIRASLIESSDDVSPEAMLSATQSHFERFGPSSLLDLEAHYVREADAALPANKALNLRPN